MLNLDPQAPRDYGPGDPLHLGITLLGEATRQVPYLLQALQLAGQRGLGRAQGYFALERLDQETTPGTDDWRPVYTPATGHYLPLAPANPRSPPAPSRAHLRLVTPLRLKRQGRLVGPAHFTLRELVFHLIGRLRLLAQHQGGDTRGLDATALLQAADSLHPDLSLLRWQEWTRYSSRQHTLMELGGLLGHLDLAGAGLADLWPLLWLGQWVHAGKGTTFGLGAYRLDADGGS